jgi:hypothetical protein
VKGSKEITADRIIEKKNVLAGGSIDQIKTTYEDDRNETLLEVYILPADTGDLASTIYYYDVDSVSTSTTSDNEPVAYGEVEIIQDVQTDYDGKDLPEQAKRFLSIDTTNFVDNTILIYTKENGFKAVHLNLIKDYIESIGGHDEIDLDNIDGVTSTTGFIDRLNKLEADASAHFESDGEGNITTKEV